MIILISQVMGGADILFGVSMGRSCLAALLSVGEPNDPEVLYLDFQGIASATVSFLREGPLSYRELLRNRQSNIYAVLANLTPAVADAVSEFLSAKRDAVFACDLIDSNVTNVRVLGQLEPKQKMTFDAVRHTGPVTATRLAEEAGDEAVGLTAWNNRLAALAAKGLLIEYRSGRSKMFRLVLDEAR